MCTATSIRCHGLVFSLCLSLATAFVSSPPSLWHPMMSNLHVHTVTDPATLLVAEDSVAFRRTQQRYGISSSSSSNDNNNNSNSWSSAKEKAVGDNSRDRRMSDRIELNELNIEKMLGQSQEDADRVVHFQGLTTMNHNKNSNRRKQIIKRNKSTKSRSSTMPGYSIPTNKQQANAKALIWLEDQTGEDMSALNTPAVQRKRKQASGDAMYQASSSVPDSLMQFAKELHQEERITPNQELQLGRLTQEAIQLQSLYDKLEIHLQREPTDEEWCAASGKINMEAIRQAMEEGIEAKNKLVTSNLRLVQGVVNVYIRNGLSGQYNAGDMMQEGILALIRAAEKFEPQRGFRFSTYAMYWIRSAVKRSQTFQSRVITIPQRLHANHKRVMLVQKELMQALGRLPTSQELAEGVGMSETQLERCLMAMEQRCFSLDQQINNRNKPNSGQRVDSLYDVLESKTDDGDFNKVSRNLVREALTESLYRALDRESAHIIMLRFGLVDPQILPRGYEGPLTIAQVSQLMGMKPDKVRRRILKSLKELKFSISSEWKDFERVVE